MNAEDGTFNTKKGWNEMVEEDSMIDQCTA